MANLPLDPEQVIRVKQLARDIADQVQLFIKQHSSVCVERATLRLYGIDGVDENNTPIPNRVIERLKAHDLLEDGVSRPFAAAMLQTERGAQETAHLMLQGKINFAAFNRFSEAELVQKETLLAGKAIDALDQSRQRKAEKQRRWNLPKQPWRYMIVATGNIYEDRTQAEAAAMAGADIIAVIRSTAQSLLDYIPYGATTEGFGGTYATQENFKIMRKALDAASAKYGRYLRLVNYASGLCMAEIAACAALEDLDMLLNDSMYGILFRDINMQRTFIDQYFSRLICSRAKITINTGEDNYLTTSDAMENAYTVTASQLINEAMARNALLTDDLLGLGHAFEINPKVENALLYEIAHASLAKHLFPNAPLKYMPPTKYKQTDIFYSHAMDTMFNFVSVLTGQGIHLAGILTEAIHTPLMQDRFNALESIDYVFRIAESLGNEIRFKEKGIIAQRAREVLTQTENFLTQLKTNGLMNGISEGRFADIKREKEGGKGLDGVFKKGAGYSNRVIQILEDQGVINE